MTSLQEWLDAHAPTPTLNTLIQHLALAGQQIATLIAQGALQGVTEKMSTTNVQGETQMQVDILSHELALLQMQHAGVVAGVVSEEVEPPVWLDAPHAPYLVCMDPLDGSSNLAINGVVGSIFSVLPYNGQRNEAAFLLAGAQQLAAAYVMYGPATLLVLTLGHGSHVFTLDQGKGSFILTQSPLKIADDSTEFAINASNQRHWQPAVQQYITECLQGEAGPRGVDFNMRWCASMVMDVHRILTRGGVFLYPRDSKQPVRAGRLRLLYEANPMSLLVTQAGGASITGEQDVLTLQPEHCHQRVPVMLGAKNEIERLRDYHRQG